MVSKRLLELSLINLKVMFEDQVSSARKRFKLRPKPLSSPVFLSAKTGLATALALLIDALIRNPDHVTSTFLSIVCTSPSISLGLARGIESLAAAAIGAIFGYIVLVLDLPIMLSVPLSVAFAVLVIVLIGKEHLFPIAGFSALFVSLIVYDNPLNTLFVRGKAISSGIIAASVVNTIVSAPQYRSIYDRKMQIVRDNVMGGLGLAHRLSIENPLACTPLFTLIEDFALTLKRASFEAKYLCSSGIVEHLNNIALELAHIHQILHLITDSAYVLKTDPSLTTEQARQVLDDIITWVRDPQLEPLNIPVMIEPQYFRLKQSLFIVKRRLSVAEAKTEFETKIDMVSVDGEELV
ncbi:hypothetical protein RCL1_008541 [Eukaryota sp. TZLM3-RCL]